MNYEKDARIDENALDVEWLEQPSLMLKYANNQSDCEEAADVLQEELDIISAELDLAIRADPSKYKLVKIVEAAVKNVIIQDVEYQKVANELKTAKYDTKMAKNAVKAIDARKHSLENLVKLHGQNYFAGPSVPRNINKEADKRREQRSSDSKVGMKLKRKK